MKLYIDHSWHRGSNPYFMNTPYIYIVYPPFSNFVPLPCCLLSQPLLFILLSYFFDWMGDCITSDILYYLMISWMYKLSLRTLMISFFLVLWFNITHTNTHAHTNTHTHTHTHTHTNKDTQHTQGTVGYVLLIAAIFITLDE